MQYMCKSHVYENTYVWQEKEILFIQFQNGILQFRITDPLWEEATGDSHKRQ